ncbi:MAG: hypothetical protein OSB45_04805 [Pseudomonadales bacterium]|jgi:hypothetical protein|nr:hypothetical protein [Pseudomonadales bacterium]
MLSLKEVKVDEEYKTKWIFLQTDGTEIEFIQGDIERVNKELIFNRLRSKGIKVIDFGVP